MKKPDLLKPSKWLRTKPEDFAQLRQGNETCTACLADWSGLETSKKAAAPASWGSHLFHHYSYLHSYVEAWGKGNWHHPQTKACLDANAAHTTCSSDLLCPTQQQ